MRNIRLLVSLAVLLSAATAVNADTIYLKNGSVLKGKVASFADDQFVVMLNTGSASRATIYIGDVSRIEFDSSGGPGPEGITTYTSPGPGRRQPDSQKGKPRVEERAGPDQDTQKGKPRMEERPGPDQDTTSAAPPPETTRPLAPPPTEATTDAPPPVRKPLGKVTTVDVLGKLEWQSSRVIVKRGDRIRITATGQVTLDPNSGQTSGPEGIEQPDPKKLMPDRPTGALIAVIGADNDDFIFIGGSAEFVAAREGLLFLSVNEGMLSDNLGSYKAVIEVQAAKAR
jgi:sRNA-binding regulator protein Hfq